MELSPIDKVIALITVVSKLADGTTAGVTGIDVALLALNDRPTASTVWTPTTFANGAGTVMLAAPLADPAGALVVPMAGADLWIRIIDGMEIDADFADRIVIN